MVVGGQNVGEVEEAGKGKVKAGRKGMVEAKEMGNACIKVGQ